MQKELERFSESAQEAMLAYNLCVANGWLLYLACCKPFFEVMQPDTRAQRALIGVDRSLFGEHEVIRARFGS